MARVPFAKREDLNPEDQKVWDEFGKSRGGVARNYAALFNNPQVAGRFGALGSYARFEKKLDPRVKALGVLTAAREVNGHYVWTVNQRAAKEAGLTDDIISAIREFRAPVGLNPDDAVVVQFFLEMLRQHRVSDATFEALRSRLGNAGVIELMVVVGYYQALANCLQTLEVDLPEGVTSALTY
jgi:4-carboxymuconolactone decarboxylase